jgi:signal transduction histidine kinase
VLEIGVQNGILQMALFDDGVGLAHVNGHARNGNGAGLENMKRRAQLLHGNLEISSPEGRGTMIRFSSEIPKNGY